MVFENLANFICSKVSFFTKQLVFTGIQIDANTFFQVMDRDRRLTGTLRGQTDKPEAPPGFEFSHGWKV